MKKFSALIICLVMIFTCSLLTGCAGFSVNEVKYYNEVIASVGDSHITRYDLLSAYSSYGYNYYVTNQGKTEEEALDSTLDLLIDREALYLYALDNKDLYKPTAYQVNELIKEMYESLDSEMENYKTEAKSVLNIKADEIEDETSSTGTAYEYENYVYKKRAKLITDENGNQKVVYNVEDDPTEFDEMIDSKYLSDFTSTEAVQAIKTNYFNQLKSDILKEDSKNGEAIYTKMISLLTQDLQDGEKYLRDENGKKFSKTTDDTLFRYIKKVFDNQIQTQYIDNIKTVYMNNETISIDELLDSYNFLVNSSADQYGEEGDYKKAMKDAGTNADSILYHPTMSDGTEFGYFIHTLIKFTDEQKTDLDAYKSADNTTEYERVLSELSAKPRSAEDGLIAEDAESVNIKDIINEYNTIKAETNYAERLEKFIQFMFKYTEDTATLSAGMPYVVGTNGNSAMEEAFTNESIKLMEQSKGAMSDVTIENVDDWCITSYGVHFVFYVGSVEDLAITNDNITIEKLYNTILNPLTHETYFDMLFDKVYPASSSDSVYSSNTEYDSHEEVVLEASKTTHKVVKYATKIKATKTSI